jgi:hypothetical protein
LALLAAAFFTTFRALEGSAPEFKPPAPSSGTWESEDSFGSGDERPNEPSIFMVESASSTPSASAQIPSFMREE